MIKIISGNLIRKTDMSGETDLQILLASMSPQLNDGEFVYCSLPENVDIHLSQIIMLYREPESITYILKKEIADSLKISYDLVFSWITLKVHSSLSAVGLTAAFSSALSEGGISCNVVAAYYHDHIFVPVSDTQKAMDILGELCLKNR